MLSEEEKKAIDYFKADVEYLEEGLKNPNYIGRFIIIQDKEFKYLKTILNLIEKQQAEIEKYKKQIDLEFVEENYIEKSELDKKDKIIDKLLTEITAVNSGRYEYMDNSRVLEIFTKKAEEN